MTDLAACINEQSIERLVLRFYERVREDPILGPIFDTRIEDWDAHLKTMIEFWSSVMLKTGRFRGRPMEKHQQLVGIEPHHFELWLALFRENAEDLFPPQIAAEFVNRANLIAASLSRGMFRNAAISNAVSA